MSEEELREEIAKSAAQITQKRLAKCFGISAQYLCDVLQGRRGISANIAERFGYRRIVTFEEIARPSVPPEHGTPSTNRRARAGRLARG